MNDPNLNLEEWEARQNANQDLGLEVESAPQVEDVEVESHQGPEESRSFSSLLSRASEKLRGLDSDTPAPKEKKSTRVNKNTRDDFSVLVVSLVTLIITFWRVPERIKPIKEEIDLFSDHISGILLRHLPINNKLSADALDIIGLLAVTATWYSRVQPEIQAIRENQGYQETPVYSAENNGKHANQTIIERLDPATASWLNRSAAQGI